LVPCDYLDTKVILLIWERLTELLKEKVFCVDVLEYKRKLLHYKILLFSLVVKENFAIVNSALTSGVISQNQSIVKRILFQPNCIFLQIYLKFVLYRLLLWFEQHHPKSTIVSGRISIEEQLKRYRLDELLVVTILINVFCRNFVLGETFV
jgi:hypothetical protein